MSTLGTTHLSVLRKDKMVGYQILRLFCVFCANRIVFRFCFFPVYNKLSPRLLRFRGMNYQIFQITFSKLRAYHVYSLMKRTSSKLLRVSFAKFVQNRRAECAVVCSVASTISGTTTFRVHGGEYRKDRIIRKDELRLVRPACMVPNCQLIQPAIENSSKPMRFESHKKFRFTP